MKIETYIKKICDSFVLADEAIYKMIDFVMQSGKMTNFDILNRLLRAYEKNDKGFKKAGAILDDDKEFYQLFKAVFCVDFAANNNFKATEKFAYFFDKFVKYEAGIITEDGRIGYQQFGAERSFVVGLPIYDMENNRLGVLSYVCDEKGWYWWQILGYKGKRLKIKTHWQILKEKEQ